MATTSQSNRHANNQFGRPDFTLRQLDQSASAGFVSEEERARRKPMTTFPIDDIPAETLSDRDDGIFIEVAPRGKGTIVHVTIADVAAHVPASSPLAAVARHRAFTVYRPGGNSTMFPQTLQDRLSLEDRQERLGLTISITLDEHYQPTHTEFQRVITDTYATSYAQANEKMQSDPQFKHMQEVARGVRDEYFGSAYTALANAGEAKAKSPNATPSQIAATKLVEVYMLLANNVTAKFFKDANIPFIYRNFNEGNARAHYSTTPQGHYDLEKKGLLGAYCHFTSPIRRGADFYDQHQAHFVMDVVRDAEEGLLKVDPALNRETVHRVLWKNSHGLLTHVAANSNNLQDIEQALIATFTDVAGSTPTGEQRTALHALTLTLARQVPPFSRVELEESAREISRLHHAEQAEATQLHKTVEALESATQRLEKIDEKTIADVAPDAFSTLLRSAALTGKLPKALLEETHKRIKGANPNGYTIEAVKDGLQIMVMASYPQDKSWRSLKKAMARRIKHDPATVNGILELAIRTSGALKEGNLQAAEASLPVTDDGFPTREAHIRGALLTYRDNRGSTLMSAPYYSIGHDIRSALSHANYSFLEHYAFGQLQPVDQIAIPNLLYAELDTADKTHYQVAEELAARVGATITIDYKPLPADEVKATLTLSGGQFKKPLQLIGTGDDKSEAEQSALRKLLRNNQFKNTSSFMDMGDMQRALNPHKVLQHLVEEAGGTMTINTTEQQTKIRHLTQYNTEITITLPAHMKGGEPMILSHHAHGPNKDRAIRDAANALLLTLEETQNLRAPTPLHISQNIGSWVETIRRNESPSGGIMK